MFLLLIAYWPVNLAGRSKPTQSDVLQSYQAKFTRFRNSENVAMKQRD